MPFWVGGYFGWSHLGENWRTLKGTNWNILELSDGTQNHLLKKFQQYTFPPIKEITTVYLHDQSPPIRGILWYNFGGNDRVPMGSISIQNRMILGVIFWTLS